MRQLKGLIVVLTTPFRDGQIDVSALQQHIMALIPYASGFVIGGTTGESGNLSDDELALLLKESRSVAQQKPLVVGFWRNTEDDTANTAHRLAPLADALLIPIPKPLFHATDEAIEDFFVRLDQSLAAPIILYNYPGRCEQRAFSADLAARIASKAKHIFGVKDSSENASLATEIIAQNLPLQPMVGNDRFLVASLQSMQQQANFKYPQASMSGASSAPQIASVEAEIYDSFNRGDLSRAQNLQQQLIDLFFNDWAHYAKELGGQAGIIKYLISTLIPSYPIKVRPPQKDITPEIIKRLRSNL